MKEEKARAKIEKWVDKMIEKPRKSTDYHFKIIKFVKKHDLKDLALTMGYDYMKDNSVDIDKRISKNETLSMAAYEACNDVYEQKYDICMRLFVLMTYKGAIGGMKRWAERMNDWLIKHSNCSNAAWRKSEVYAALAASEYFLGKGEDYTKHLALVDDKFFAEISELSFILEAISDVYTIKESGVYSEERYLEKKAYVEVLPYFSRTINGLMSLIEAVYTRYVKKDEEGSIDSYKASALAFSGAQWYYIAPIAETALQLMIKYSEPKEISLFANEVCNKVKVIHYLFCEKDAAYNKLDYERLFKPIKRMQNYEDRINRKKREEEEKKAAAALERKRNQQEADYLEQIRLLIHDKENESAWAEKTAAVASKLKAIGRTSSYGYALALYEIGGVYYYYNKNQLTIKYLLDAAKKFEVLNEDKKAGEAYFLCGSTYATDDVAASRKYLTIAKKYLTKYKDEFPTYMFMIEKYFRIFDDMEGSSSSSSYSSSSSSSSSSASEGDIEYNRGVEAYNNGNYSAARNHFRDAARAYKKDGTNEDIARSLYYRGQSCYATNSNGTMEGANAFKEAAHYLGFCNGSEFEEMQAESYALAGIYFEDEHLLYKARVYYEEDKYNNRKKLKGIYLATAKAYAKVNDTGHAKYYLELADKI